MACSSQRMLVRKNFEDGGGRFVLAWFSKQRIYHHHFSARCMTVLASQWVPTISLHCGCQLTSVLCFHCCTFLRLKCCILYFNSPVSSLSKTVWWWFRWASPLLISTTHPPPPTQSLFALLTWSVSPIIAPTVEQLVHRMNKMEVSCFHPKEWVGSINICHLGFWHNTWDLCFTENWHSVAIWLHCWHVFSLSLCQWSPPPSVCARAHLVKWVLPIVFCNKYVCVWGGENGFNKWLSCTSVDFLGMPLPYLTGAVPFQAPDLLFQSDHKLVSLYRGSESLFRFSGM